MDQYGITGNKKYKIPDLRAETFKQLYLNTAAFSCSVKHKKEGLQIKNM